jgi:hypothetical protein
MPLPGLMQASRVPGLLAARIAIGTSTAHAITEIPAMKLLRVKLMLIWGLLCKSNFRGASNLFAPPGGVKKIAECPAAVDLISFSRTGSEAGGGRYEIESKL